MERWPDLDMDADPRVQPQAGRDSGGATVLDPVGTAPGLVVPPARGAGPTVVVLRDRRASSSRCGRGRVATDAFRGRSAARRRIAAGSSGCSASPSPRSRTRSARPRTAGSIWRRWRSRRACAGGRSRSPPATSRTARGPTTRSSTSSADRHADTLYSEDGSTIDEQVAGLLAGHTIAVAESCTGGLMAARLTDRAGSSAYMRGGVVAYSNEAKSELVGVDPELIERAGAVSTEVAEALAEGDRGALRRRARRRDHRDRRPRRRDGGEAGRAWSASRVDATDGLPRRLIRRSCCLATAPTSGIARRRSRCTCCGACSRRVRRWLPGEVAGPLRLVTGDHARLFVALELPAEVRSALERWSREHAGASPGAAVQAESLHVTLCFLGSRPVARSMRSRAACERGVGPGSGGADDRRRPVAAAAAPARARRHAGRRAGAAGRGPGHAGRATLQGRRLL